MAQIDKLYKSMGLPMNIKRGNPWPLDVSSLWYSYDEMKAYAEDADSVAYVGQILGLVDEENNSAEAYIIADSNGTLKPIGSGVVLVDEKTIMIDSETEEIGLKDFGKRFYKYIPEVKDDEGNIVLEAGYELTEVSSINPWAAGLEPRVVSEDGVLVLGWFEPNPTTIEGINNQVSSLQTSVSDLQKVTEELMAEVGSPAEGETAASGIYAELDKKANAADVYNKSEVDVAIETAVSKADHLQRKIVTSFVDITTFINEKGAEEAAKYIFMVPESDLTADGNIYEEYMVINGVIEVVGKWATDLSDYVTNTELTDSLKNYVKTTDLNTKLIDYATTEITDQLNNEIIGIAVEVGNKVDKDENARLITLEEAAKLEALNINGEENVINSVTEDFSIDENKKLSLNKESLDLSNNTEVKSIKTQLNGLITTVNTMNESISSLRESINFNKTSLEELQNKQKTLEESVKNNKDSIDALTLENTSLENRLSGLTQNVEDNTSSISSITARLNDFVLKTVYEKDISDIKDILTWKTIEETPAE